MAEQLKNTELNRILDETTYCAMNTLLENGEINSRFMLFANVDSLDAFYLMTNKQTEKVAELKRNPKSTLSILTPAEDIMNYRETVVKGQISILDDFDNDDVQHGLALLAKKLPMVQGLLDSGGLGDYVVFQMKTDDLKHRIYSEILENVPPTLVTFS